MGHRPFLRDMRLYVSLVRHWKNGFLLIKKEKHVLRGNIVDGEMIMRRWVDLFLKDKQLCDNILIIERVIQYS